MEVKFMKLHQDAIIPQYQSSGAAGVDFHTLVEAHVVPGIVTPVRTGIAVELPPGHFMLITPRSGLSIYYPSYVSNSPGVIDEDYRGEIKVLMVAHHGRIHLEKGTRFAQGIIIPCAKPDIHEVNHLGGTDRGDGGFGSTGR
jgi:dUTP pyrophosphatase